MFDTPEKKKLRQQYRTTFESDSGKAVLKDLMKFAMFFDSTYVPKDPESTAYNEGMRRIVLRIIAIMERQPLDNEQVLKQLVRYTDE